MAQTGERILESQDKGTRPLSRNNIYLAKKKKKKKKSKTNENQKSYLEATHIRSNKTNNKT
jgi:hypothetical protein